MFFLLYKRADDAVFDDFPKIFQNCSEGQRNVSEQFSSIFRTFFEDYRGLPKMTEEEPIF